MGRRVILESYDFKYSNEHEGIDIRMSRDGNYVVFEHKPS